MKYMQTIIISPQNVKHSEKLKKDKDELKIKLIQNKTKIDKVNNWIYVKFLDTFFRTT